MTFDDILEQVITLLKRQGRVSYRALKMRFDEIDDEYLEVLKEEILYVHPVIDDEGRGLIWTGDTEDIQGTTTSQPDPPETQSTAQKEPPIQVDPPLSEPSVPEAERRQLTILFTDLVDSTKLSGQLDAEDYRELVRGYQAACAEVIERFDCHLAQTLGDGLLIYSGYPVAHENDAERAVRVGLGILESMTVLNERLDKDKGIRLGVRIGIHTGQVVVGDVGSGSRQEQLALGETPNIAARIQGLAEPNSIVFSSATSRLVQGYFDCESLGEQTLRGVAEPMAIYRVLSESDAQGRLDIVSRRGLTPLVGRQSELQLLIDRWNQAKSGEGQVVLLNAEPGLGKSRMVQALREHLVDEAYTRLECRSSPYYQNTALYPIVDMMQRTLQFQADDTPEQRLEKLERELSQYRLLLEETVPLFASQLSLSIPEDRYPPLNLSPQRQRQKTLETLVAIVLELAEREPVLFILEDLHWTDPTTLELLDLLIDQIPTAQMLTLITYRPEFQPTWGNRSYLSQITLNRLSQHQIEQLAEHVAGDKSLPPDVLQQLVEKTDGVPLYVEEMTKAVLESDVLKEINDHYEIVGSLASLSIPSTLQDSLMARLDRLMTAKVIAQLGATIGRQFSYDLLHQVAQLDETMLQYELSRLVDAELLHQRGVPPQAMYTFKHALIQDTAYESLLRSTRQGYHKHIAQLLEEQFPETAANQPELLAHHLTEGGLNEQAIGYWHNAGQRAVERSANMEAIEHYKKALEVQRTLPDTPERTEQEIGLLIALGQPLNITKGYGSSDVEHVYAQAYALCQKVEDSPHLFSTLLELGRNSIFHAEYQRVRELGEQLLALAESLQEPERFLEAHFTLGTALLWMGELETSLFHIRKSHSLYESQKSHSLMLVSGHDHEVGCLTYEARTLWFLGYPDQGLACPYEALARSRDLSHPFSQARALTFVATLHYYRREAQQTQKCTEELLAISREHDYVHWVSYGVILGGWALAMQGQVDNGIAQIQEGMADQERMGHRHARIWWLIMLAEAHRGGNHVENGLEVLAEAFTLIEQTRQRVLEAELHRLKGQLLLQQSLDNASEVETCFQQAIAIAQNQSAKSWELRAATSLAKLWQSQGRRDEARELLEPVYSWFTEGFDTADLVDAKMLLDELSEGR